MRIIFGFVFGFIFFGLLYYAIWMYAPEVFHALTAWAAKFFEFIKGLIPPSTGSATEPAKSMLLLGLSQWKGWTE